MTISAKKMPAAVDECRLLNSRQVQKMFGIGRTQLWRLRKNAKDPFPVVYIGKQPKFRLDQILWWLDKHAA